MSNRIVIRTSLAVGNAFLHEPLRWAMLALIVKLAAVNPTGPAPASEAVDHLQTMDAGGDPCWGRLCDNSLIRLRWGNGLDQPPLLGSTHGQIAPMAPSYVLSMMACLHQLSVALKREWSEVSIT